MGPSIDPNNPERFVTVYRACDSNVLEIHDFDYVTTSYRFAVGHAQHQLAVTEEPQVVLRLLTKAKNIFEAGNPGEYFFHQADGKSAKAKVVKTFS